MKTGRLKYDFAYGCYMLCGVTALLIAVIGKAEKNDNTSVLLGFFVPIPLAFASFAVMVAALVLSMILGGIGSAYSFRVDPSVGRGGCYGAWLRGVLQTPPSSFTLESWPLVGRVAELER